MTTRVLACAMCLLGIGSSVGAQPRQGELRVFVRSEGAAVAGATVAAGPVTAVSDATGPVVLQVPAGTVRASVRHPEYFDAAQDVQIVPGRAALLEIELVRRPTVEEEVIVVATTRTGRQIGDQPTRVEVLGREEIEEKMLMTPGDIVMMLNEMGGMRVQATSPSIGAASVRVQGMKGRYTRFLSDGLPLFGQQVGGLGLLQIPPMDLGRVEVIKGVASALYGAGAMGGVVNLLTRQPAAEPVTDLLVNQSTLGSTDAVAFLSRPIASAWRLSVLAGGHLQLRNDRDGDEWADLAGYGRGVVRPRVFWDPGNGRSAFVTAGVTVENREGGTMPGASLAATGAPHVESLETQRYDVGGSVQTLVSGRYVLTGRSAAAWQRHDHRFGDVRERDRHDTFFGELALRGAAGRHTWVAGAAYERDRYAPTDVPRFAYTYTVPGVFAQDDVDVASWLSLSAGARLDWHSEYGAFLSPRLAAFFHHGGWASRLSVGRGFFASTPLTEETEAAGLTRLEIRQPLRAERGTSVSIDLTRAIGALTLTATAFGSRIEAPVAVDRDTDYVLFNRAGATTNGGAEFLATLHRGRWAVTSTYTYVRSREESDDGRQDVALTPRHSAGLVGMWEEEWGRVGLELYYTGRQRLEVNPYRTTSEPYIIAGLLVEKRIGRARVFLNAENLTNVRQTRWDSLLRPTRGVDGRWTVDAWAPLDGRVINGGVRIGF